MRAEQLEKEREEDLTHTDLETKSVDVSLLEQRGLRSAESFTSELHSLGLKAASTCSVGLQLVLEVDAARSFRLCFRTSGQRYTTIHSDQRSLKLRGILWEEPALRRGFGCGGTRPLTC